MQLIPKAIGVSMNYMNINFAQPLWLYALILVPIGWLWSYYWAKTNKANSQGLTKFIDQKLLVHLLVNKNNKEVKSNTGWLYTAFTICIILALANPRWGYKEFDAYQPTASMVILLDLSTSMNATDVLPSRIVRARQNIEDLLNLSHGLKIGLIGFARYPHLISPITDDIQTIRTFLPALDTDLSDLQGNSLSSSLHLATELLAAEPGDKKSILLVSDGNISASNYSKELSALQAKNIQVHVIGIGTDTGAPYKNKNGMLHKVQGKVITSKLNSATLKDIAKHGHGIYTEATYNDFGLRAILHKAETTRNNQLVEGKIRQWNDRYYMFLIPAAGILLYLMRKRVLYTLIIFLSCSSLLSSNVYAFSVQDLFTNSEQQGQKLYDAGDFKRSAESFRDPYQKGVALYRDGQFAQAEEQFNKVERSNIKTSALYNAGNSQMQQQKWRSAIKSYENVLAIEPYNPSAQHNLELARKMLAANDGQDKEDDNCECKDKDKQSNKDNKEKKGSQDKQDNSTKQDTKDKQDNTAKQDTKDKQDNTAKQDAQNKQDNADKQDAQSKQNNIAKQDSQDKQDSNNEKNEQAKATNTQQKDNAMQQQANIKLAEDEARIEQLLNRVDSDIKVFLKNKIYLEDVLSEQ